MLMQFSVSNFKSYWDSHTFSMIASADSTHCEGNVTTARPSAGQRSRPIDLVTGAAIYGANASGKSNLLHAFAFMKRFVFSSSKDMQIDEDIPVEPCMVVRGSELRPSSFEVIFHHKGIVYRYGFEVTRKSVLAEWLFYSPKGKEAKLFVRNGDDFEIGTSFFEGKGLPSKTRANALFLSVCAQFNGQLAAQVLDLFKTINVISGVDDSGYVQFTVNQMENSEYRDQILKFLRLADLSIDDATTTEHEMTIEQLPEPWRTKAVDVVQGREAKDATATIQELRFTHATFDDADRTESRPFDRGQESQGTQKLFAIAGPIIDTLRDGKTLLIDELGNSLHPLLSQHVVGLFNNRGSNPNGAQLIFTTHDTNLLSGRFFRRDQIWFTEKDAFGRTDLYALSDFKIRKEATYNKDYIMGKYGAIPYIADGLLPTDTGCE